MDSGDPKNLSNSSEVAVAADALKPLDHNPLTKNANPDGEKFFLDTSSNDGPGSGIAFGLTLRPTDQISTNGNSRKSRVDEFKDVKVEDFLAGVMLGYGLTEQMEIRPNGNVTESNIFENRSRIGNAGLGCKNSTEGMRKKNGVWVPEERESAKETEKKKRKVVFEEKNVRVVCGRFKGLVGKLVMKLDVSEFLVRLCDNGDEVGLEDYMFVELGSVEEDKFLRKMKKLEMEWQEKKGKKGDKKKKKDRTSIEIRTEETKSSTRVFKGSSGSTIRWLRSHIRVKVVSKELKGGKLYMKKGQVIDVVSPTTCDIKMDGSGELVQGVDQEYLETTFPKTGGSMLVLYGEHKGIFGTLVCRNTEDGTGIVRDADSHEFISVHLDEIAEYLGDPSDLGY